MYLHLNVTFLCTVYTTFYEQYIQLVVKLSKECLVGDVKEFRYINKKSSSSPKKPKGTYFHSILSCGANFTTRLCSYRWVYLIMSYFLYMHLNVTYYLQYTQLAVKMSKWHLAGFVKDFKYINR